MILWSILASTEVALGAVTSLGNVTPAPPVGGGTMAGPLFIGDSTVGSVTINAGTPLTVNAGNVILGDDVTGVGILSLTGLGSNLAASAAGADMVIGNAGTGSAVVTALAQLTAADDLFLGVVDGSSGTLFLDDLGTVLYVPDVATIGQAGGGVLQVTEGARAFISSTIVGQTGTSDGRLTISGHMSLWRQSGALTVGDAGRGLLQVLSGAHIESANAVVASGGSATGIVEVGGYGSVWELFGSLNLGSAGHASLRLFDSGQISSSGAIRLGTLAGGEGRVEVTGANSQWNSGSTITVGENGTGTFDVLNGGRVTSSSVVLGDNASARGEATISGDDSLWEITGTLAIADEGSAAMSLGSGGRVTVTGTTQVGSAGELFLAGGRLAAAGGLTNQGLILGGGRLENAVTNGASGEIRLRPSNSITITGTLTNSGQINIDSGELEVLGAATNSLDIDIRSGALRFNQGVTNNSGGDIAIVGGAVDVFGSITNLAGGRIVVGGKAHAAFHDPFTNNGNLLVMPGAELLTLENLAFGAGSALTVELQQLPSDVPDADATEAYGQVHVTGQSTLAGTLNVSLAGDFSPEIGDTFQILTSLDGRSGTFATENLPALSGGLGWDVQYGANAVILAVVSALAGDFNADGIVDAADYTVWRNNLGDAHESDLHHNGDGGGVTASDYLWWKQHYGNAISGSGAAIDNASIVPEPTAILTMVTGLIALSFRRRLQFG
jgi:T5SS/PEP-CTERM-associated repeat protein